MESIDRVFTLHRMLSHARVPVPLVDLRERLECSVPTVRRTIATLRDGHGAPVEYVREPQNGYRYAPGAKFELPGLFFTAAELQALLTCQELLSHLEPGLLDEHLEPLRERIDTLLSQRRLLPGRLNGRIRIVPGVQRRLDIRWFAPVADALLRRRRLKLVYRGRHDDRRSERTVSPQRLAWYRNNWYLDVWDHDRDALRTLSLDRIEHVETLELPAENIAEQTLNDLLTAGYGIFSGPVAGRARLRFSALAARWVADEKWHSGQQGRVLPDGGYELEIPYSATDELVMDILRYGPEVEVLGPAALRRQVRERLAAALKKYDT